MLETLTVCSRIGVRGSRKLFMRIQETLKRIDFAESDKTMSGKWTRKNEQTTSTQHHSSEHDQRRSGTRTLADGDTLDRSASFSACRCRTDAENSDRTASTVAAEKAWSVVNAASDGGDADRDSAE